MKGYGSPKIPAGSHNREFLLLDENEQRAAVRRLSQSGYDQEAICSVTGLTPIEVAAMLA